MCDRGGVPLLLCDLDNTLVDRTSLYRAWVRQLAEAHGGTGDDVDHLVQVDAEGMTSRELAAEAIRTRFALTDEVPVLVERFRQEFASTFVADVGVAEALVLARAAGWSIVIVTNGYPGQEAKIRAAGLDQLVDGWCISAVEDVWKPDALIFERAASLVGSRLSADDWMVGDSAEADIAGGAGVGVGTAWLHRGRDWPLADLRPTVVADSFAHAVEQVLGTDSTSNRR